ncbi:MAG: sulfite exporter TauE/SafE family protein [Pseudomonadota bacterium]
MSGEFLFFLIAGAIAGGFVNGLAGFGTALFTLGWWLQILPPVEAVGLVLVMSVVSGLQGMVLVWRSIDWRRLAVFLVPALIGIPVGLQILSFIDATTLKILVATALLTYGGYFSLRRSIPTVNRQTPMIDGSVGFLGGILGAIGGLSGALLTMWCAIKPWTKTETRAVLQTYNMTVLTLAALGLFIDGKYQKESLLSMVIMLPVAMVSTQAGIMTYKRMSDSQFRRLLIVLMFLSGIIIILREAWVLF